MIDRSNKDIQQIEISLGLLVGYLMMGVVNALYTTKAWDMVFSSEHILTSVAGIILSVIILFRGRNKRKIENRS